MSEPTPHTAFHDTTRIASGSLATVALAVRTALAMEPTAAILVFDDTTGKVVDLDLRGSDIEIAARYTPKDSEMGTANDDAPRARGRPKLGVVAREVTLLPRHWDWLALQPGGASQALRRLVDEARKADGGRSQARAAQAAAYAFIATMAGDREGFEEASRALFAGDDARFAEHSRSWPADIQAYAQRLITGSAHSGPKP